jgi:hypothetical protein
MKTQLKPSPAGIYHKESRLHWYAIAFVNHEGEPFMVAAPSIKSAKALAKYHTTNTDLVIERITIRKNPNP